MATRTPNLSLIKPGPDDAVDVADLNENFDKIDNFAGGVGGDTYTKSEIDEMLAEKVDTEEGKGLSTNDYTNEEKAQVANIANKVSVEDVYGTGRAISSNGTMDDVRLGKFFCSNSATSSTVTNAPWTDSGFFGYTERSISASDRYIQIAIRNDSVFSIAKRRYLGNWTAWVYSGSYMPSVAGSIKEYVTALASLDAGVFHAFQPASVGTDKPINGYRYTYLINIYSSTNAVIIAYEAQLSTNPCMYMTVMTSGTWGSWYKFEGTALQSGS